MVKYVLICLLLAFSGSAFSADDKDIVIVIDPGHGGKDYGRLASKDDYMHEKELNLIIAKKLGNYIQTNLSHVKIIYTRTDDSYPSLTSRCNLANNKKADYFISIHCNGSPNNSSAKGTETHVNSFENKTSYQFALQIEKEFKTRAGRKSRGVKNSADRHHSLQVLKDTDMPSILIEAGFMSNSEEEAYLNSSYGQEIIASAIFRATRTFLKKKHPSINFTEGVNEANDDSPHYRVQIMSSIDEVATDIPEFKKLGVVVTRRKVNSSSMYKYKYTIGKSKDKKEIKKLQKLAREKGFKDAYIVRY